MKVIKVFISQKMHGVGQQAIWDNRMLLLKDFEEFLDSIKVEYDNIQVTNMLEQEPGHSRTWYLANAITTMEEADFIIFANDWMEAKGCCVEHEVASRYYTMFLHDPAVGNGNISEIWWGPIS